ncbi:oxidoreductase domain protein [Pirellula staleyi DSM 6068]|uniref:Oxidoreductase domain protein n=1 Tax=Pirellula staleyi (strain ATCC 27377 / DSM 6068 / ICPB 4128) TaxID=530564 RepID=D2R4X9_PIRSD|nr:Gfo/Idh/MocA family oxidoreductase [Pirellula staleyi]ADB18941.1 oxidoreductase domain protein [Pirellula staleyi DSM 6068]
MSRGTNRRRFMQTTAALGVGFWVAGGVSPRESRSANETINFASVGVNGKGSSDSADAGRSGNMVAICDIDDQSLAKAATRFTDAKKYNDYRKMLDEMGKSIDAITVSTPDHCHGVIGAAAMKLGKHCFIQKPLTKSLHEARVLGQLAKDNKVATQMGNQGTASNSLREAAAVVKSGVLGTIKEVHVWTNRPVWPQGIDKPTDTPECPSHVHWPEFVGPVENRPYNPVYHPFKWRGWWAFGTGALGDMACHTLNMPFMALDLRDPVSVQATTSGHNMETFPSWSVIDYKFPERNGRAALTFMWYDGGKKPDPALFQGAKIDSSGCLVIGEKGALYAPGDYAERGLQMLGGITKPEVEYKKSPGHFEEWVAAIKGGESAMSNFPNYAAPLTETVLLGNLAVWAAAGEQDPEKKKAQGDVVGKKIEWDAANLTATNAPEVASIVKPEMKNGYSL